MILSDYFSVATVLIDSQRCSELSPSGTAVTAGAPDDQGVAALFLDHQMRCVESLQRDYKQVLRDCCTSAPWGECKRPNPTDESTSSSNSNRGESGCGDDDDALLFTSLSTPPNWLPMYERQRRDLYLAHAHRLGTTTSAQSLYQLMCWCDDRNVFIHPSVRILKQASPYRDHALVVTQAVPKYCPLLAIPESLCIGFQDMSQRSNNLPLNDLCDEDKEKQFAEATGAGDSDICQFFFESLGMIVSDLISALHSPHSDRRHGFAQSMRFTRTLMNAPYFDDSVTFGKEDTALADVLLQMIRNYILGGPLVGKVDRDELRWAVSLCLSHATPLAIASARSIGIIPLVCLLPHGGSRSNAVVVARTNRSQSGKRMSACFRSMFGFDFAAPTTSCPQGDYKWIYLVASRDLAIGEEVLTQAMAPVCAKESEADHMWRLSCGAAPADFVSTASLSALQATIAREIASRGSTGVDK